MFNSSLACDSCNMSGCHLDSSNCKCYVVCEWQESKLPWNNQSMTVMQPLQLQQEFDCSAKLQKALLNTSFAQMRTDYYPPSPKATDPSSRPFLNKHCVNALMKASQTNWLCHQTTWQSMLALLHWQNTHWLSTAHSRRMTSPCCS